MVETINYSTFETLQDGRRVEIRAQRAQDGDGLRAAIARMSNESLYRRFFVAKHEFSDKEVEHFLNIDFINQVALVVVVNENGRQGIGGGGRYTVR
jgi:hypothetical protein